MLSGINKTDSFSPVGGVGGGLPPLVRASTDKQIWANKIVCGDTNNG